MRCDYCNGLMVEKKVIYTVEFQEHLYIIENVPARECLQCGEKLYSPETVEKIQKAVWEGREPDRIIKTPVFQFASI